MSALHWFAAHWIPIASFVGVYVTTTILSKKSQIDAWCEANPRRAGISKIVRSLIPGEWYVLVQGLSLIFLGKMPPSYVKVLDVVIKDTTPTGK
jgi:hypothetical protein